MEELKRVGGTSDATSTRKNVLVFAINGKRYEVSCDFIHPSTTLLEFLRSHTPFKSVKLCCGEGVLFSFCFLLFYHFISLFLPFSINFSPLVLVMNCLF